MNWISVNDNLPGYDIDVLTCLVGVDSGRMVYQVLYRHKSEDDDWQWLIGGSEIANCWDITHWMPLPDPPSE